MSNGVCYARNISFLPAAEVRRMSLTQFRRFVEYVFERGSIHANNALGFFHRVEYSTTESVDAIVNAAPTLLHIFLRNYAYDGVKDFVISVRVFVGAIPAASRENEIGFWGLHCSIQTATFLLFHIRMALFETALNPRPPLANGGEVAVGHGESAFQRFSAQAMGHGESAFQRLSTQSLCRRWVEKICRYRRRLQDEIEREEFHRRRQEAAERRVDAFRLRIEEMNRIVNLIIRRYEQRR